MRKAIGTWAFLGGILAIALVVARGWEYGYSVKSVAYLGMACIILGGIVAPQAEPRAFRYPALWQVAFAVVGCVLIALAWDAPPEGYLLAVVGGAVLGYAAPVWIKFLSL